MARKVVQILARGDRRKRRLVIYEDVETAVSER